MLLKLTLTEEATGEVLNTWFTDEELQHVRWAIEDGSCNGLSVFDSKAEYDEANKEP